MTKPTPAMAELIHWISARQPDPEKARAAAERLHAAIGKDVTDAEHLRLRAEAMNAALVEESRQEVMSCRSMLRAIRGFAKDRTDDTGRRIYHAIGRFNLGQVFQPGTPDATLVPVELRENPPEVAPRPVRGTRRSAA